MRGSFAPSPCRKPHRCLAVQQAEVIRGLTDLNVGFLCGEMGVDFWSRDHWRNWLALHECIVLTPQLLLDALRHGFVAVRARPIGFVVAAQQA